MSTTSPSTLAGPKPGPTLDPSITHPPLVSWFTDLGRDDVAVVGGKGANLGEMTRAGLPVPPGFVVTVDAYRRFADGLDGRGPMDTMVNNALLSGDRDQMITVAMGAGDRGKRNSLVRTRRRHDYSAFAPSSAACEASSEASVVSAALSSAGA